MTTGLAASPSLSVRNALTIDTDEPVALLSRGETIVRECNETRLAGGDKGSG